MLEPTSPFIVGDLCYLRGLIEADLTGDYFHWLNDAETMRYMESGRYPNTLDDMRAYLAALRANHSKVMFAVCDKITNKHIGNTALSNIHPIHRRADFGILIGDKAYWGRGFGTQATRLTVDYGFRRLNLHSIWLGVSGEHQAAIRAYEKVGFKLDGIAREAFWADGKFHDQHQMSILAREYFEQYA